MFPVVGNAVPFDDRNTLQVPSISKFICVAISVTALASLSTVASSSRSTRTPLLARDSDGDPPSVSVQWSTLQRSAISDVPTCGLTSASSGGAFSAGQRTADGSSREGLYRLTVVYKSSGIA